MSIKTLEAVIITVGVFSFSAARAEGDFCTTDVFASAFVKGQGVMEDFVTVSPELTSFGDKAVPCLIAIAERGEATFDISCQLQEVDGGCRMWAIKALGSIPTPQARLALTGFLSTSDDVILLQEAVLQLGAFEAATTRPTLLRMLRHAAPAVRVSAVTALTTIRNPADFEELLETILLLPDEYLYPAAVAVSTLADPRLIDPLQPTFRNLQGRF